MILLKSFARLAALPRAYATLRIAKALRSSPSSFDSSDAECACILHPGGLAGPVITQMARRRFRSNQRHEPVTERSFQEYLYSTAAPQTKRPESMRLSTGGRE